MEWYAVEENCIYVSKFYWKKHSVRENVLYIEDKYYDWIERNIDFDNALLEENESDCGVWYFLKYSTNDWHEWHTYDNFARYKKYNAFEVKYPFPIKT